MATPTTTVVAAVCAVLALAACGAQALMFNLPANGQRCLRDEMQANQLVAGEYEVSEAPGQNVHYIVSSLLRCRLCAGVGCGWLGEHTHTRIPGEQAPNKSATSISHTQIATIVEMVTCFLFVCSV